MIELWQVTEEAIVRVPTWVVTLLVANITGLLANAVIVAWWASRINTMVARMDDELRERIRPTLHKQANELQILVTKDELRSQGPQGQRRRKDDI